MIINFGDIDPYSLVAVYRRSCEPSIRLHGLTPLTSNSSNFTFTFSVFHEIIFSCFRVKQFLPICNAYLYARSRFIIATGEGLR
jgi:hypothetical protein